MRELCPSSRTHTRQERTPSHTTRLPLHLPLSLAAAERCWCVSMMPPPPPPPLPSAAITARRRAIDTLPADSGLPHDVKQSIRILQSNNQFHRNSLSTSLSLFRWLDSLTRPKQVSCPYGCSTIDTDLLEGIGRNDVVVEEAL